VSRPAKHERGRVDWFGTLIRTQGPPLEPEDLRYKALRNESGLLLLVVLDSSGSTSKGRSLVAAKGLLASLVEAAYLERSRLGILEIGGRSARWGLHPRRAPRQLDGLLDRIGAGGGTPLRQGLGAAVEVLRRERRRLPTERQLLILITDGRSRDSVHDLRPPSRTLVVDMEAGPVRLGRCRALAEELRGEYVRLVDLPVKAAGSGRAR
jgi:magnesium chelatase subunit ChlD-like protein